VCLAQVIGRSGRACLWLTSAEAGALSDLLLPPALSREAQKLLIASDRCAGGGGLLQRGASSPFALMVDGSGGSASGRAALSTCRVRLPIRLCLSALLA